MATIEKDIQLFGLGSALVDVQVKVEDADLERYGMRKGTMSLVDAQEQHGILGRFADLPTFRCSGGATANTLIAFSQFGGRGGFSTLLGNDAHGRFYASEFEELGIELFSEFEDEAHTGTCLVLITPDAERTMHTSLAVNTNFGRDHVAEDAIKRSQWLYIEGYKFAEANGRAAIERAMTTAREHGTRIALNFSDVFVVETFGDELRKAVEQADLVICNELEGRSYTGLSDDSAVFNKLKQTARNTALTLGERGAMLNIDGEEAILDAYKTAPIDSTGAGDMFAAGLFYGLLNNYSLEHAGHLGACAASKVISQLGARLEREEVRDVLVHVDGMSAD